MILVAYGTHVGHGVRCGTQAEATHAGYQDGSVVVATEDAEGKEISEQYHDDDLRHQDDDEGERQ